MPIESPRIADLRRRVEADPASIAFAQLAEEYRRAGNYQAAEACCRAGLARHPGYLSARVTLGRSLIELGKLDEAATELQSVLKGAPDNLAAIRGIAEIHQRRGNLEGALEYYRRALPLARHDPELEETVSQINRALGGTSPPATSGLSLAQAESEILSAASRMVPLPAPPEPPRGAPPIAAKSEPIKVAEPPRAVEPSVAKPAEPVSAPTEPPATYSPSLSGNSGRFGVTGGETLSAFAPVAPVVPGGSSFAPRHAEEASADKPDFDAPIDFDALLRSLSGGDVSTPPMVESLLSEPEPAAIRPEPVLPDLAVDTDADDRFAALERGLREFDTPAYTLTELDTESTFAPPETPQLDASEWPHTEEAVRAVEPASVSEPAAQIAPAAYVEPAADVEPPQPPEPAMDPSEQAVLAELEAWLAAIKR